ncbi:MAG: molybdopterin molybdotransferase MoeA [Sneathiellaceae bacterium]
MPGETLSDLLPVAEARRRIVAALAPVAAEFVPLALAHDRVLADAVTARRTQPPVAVSAMDGWAVRAADLSSLPVQLRIAGEIPAGVAAAGSLSAGEAMRIFTGAPLPDGADTVVLQEDCRPAEGRVEVREGGPEGRWVRPAGLDFRAGEALLQAGTRLTSRDIALAAAMNLAWLPVRRRPRIAVLATGDELVRPGEQPGPNQIVASNSYGLMAWAGRFGAQPVDLGIATDDVHDLARLAAGAAGCDLLVTLGGASVGDHDLVQRVLAADGRDLDFWRIAMRPGKPLMFGTARVGGPAALPVPLLGLPGNPVSAMVCALLFLRPALDRLLGIPDAAAPLETAALGQDLPANDRREDFLRARLATGPDGGRIATPFSRQDSSMLRLLAESQCLVRRAPHAPALQAGAQVEILRFDYGF